MRQAILRAPRQIEVVDVEREPLRAGDARIAVDACGVCGSDVASYLHGHHVQLGQVMGHELAGTVLEAGASVKHLAVGDRVLARPIRSCGRCAHCRGGEPHLCGASNVESIGYGADGGFAEELIVRGEAEHRQLLAIPSQTPPEDALWAEPLAVCLHALDRAEVGPGAKVQVAGAGPLGLGLVAAAVAGGLTVEAVEPRAARRRAALALGAAAALPPQEQPGDPIDALLDASGVPGAISAGAARVRPGGTVVLLGLGEAKAPPVPAGVRVRGSFACTPQDFERAARLIAGGQVRLGAAVSHQFPLSSVAQAIETAADDQSAVKVAVRPLAGATPDRRTDD